MKQDYLMERMPERMLPFINCMIQINLMYMKPYMGTPPITILRMKLEISQLMKQKTWERISISDIPKNLPGIRIKKLGERQFHLTQTGLTNKVLKVANMAGCNHVPTPSSSILLVIDADREEFQEDWEYATVVGMLVYLAQHSIPDIAYAVHQCARFMHAPRKSHVIGIKQILRYLQGIKDKGLILNPTTKLQVDFYVDAGFS